MQVQDSVIQSFLDKQTAYYFCILSCTAIKEHAEVQQQLNSRNTEKNQVVRSRKQTAAACKRLKNTLKNLAVYRQLGYFSNKRV
ncbi:hypothetical protein DDV21_004075 [Streptococcus chenjunshii]|uniref:Uncharacterized protein n=1 Tax=Streptococcus chenjunshii TaxID=2173853 RepID=A0A372KIV5_9STRE|nr:hypothetical protein DDV21_004075 [Streptococcus chenjunshii]RFU50094.1 hypothetical protein DDV22_10450 [Streptococcus chenjunshii]RFU52222.1 hypothetical protein DDV23_10805 [Streptococcus chenjunshii]